MEKDSDSRPQQLLADRTRLSLMAHLVSLQAPVEFSNLLNDLGLSKGNLSVHMSKLEEAGLVKIEKAFVYRKPCTTYECTTEGRQALTEYIDRLEALLKPAKKSLKKN